MSETKAVKDAKEKKGQKEPKARVRLLREHGRLIRRAPDEPWPAYIGELLVKERRDAPLRRQVLQARLFDINEGTNAELLPELMDVRLLWVENHRMRLTGFERIDGADYAQTWSVNTAPDTTPDVEPTESEAPSA